MKIFSKVNFNIHVNFFLCNLIVHTYSRKFENTDEQRRKSLRIYYQKIITVSIYNVTTIRLQYSLLPNL